MNLTGFEGQGPIRTGAPIVDYGVALAASFAISSALFKRTETGRGSFIDVSMLETAYTLMSSTIVDYFLQEMNQNKEVMQQIVKARHQVALNAKGLISLELMKNINLLP